MKHISTGLLALVGFAFTMPQIALGGDLNETPIGSKVSGTVTLGHNQVVLPEGEFEVATIHNHTLGAEENKVTRLVLVQREGDVVKAYVRLFATLDHTRGIRDWRDQPCKRDDYLFKLDKSSSVQRQECLWVNHHTNVMTRPNSNNKIDWGFHLYLKEHKLRMPSTLVGASYMRYVPAQMMWVDYLFNPELAGFSPEAPMAWQMSAWHKDASAKDDHRQALVRRLSDWLVNSAAKENDAGFEHATAKPVTGPDLKGG